MGTKIPNHNPSYGDLTQTSKPHISTTASPIETIVQGPIVLLGFTERRCPETPISNRFRVTLSRYPNFDLDYREKHLSDRQAISRLDAERPLFQIWNLNWN